MDLSGDIALFRRQAAINDRQEDYDAESRRMLAENNRLTSQSGAALDTARAAAIPEQLRLQRETAAEQQYQGRMQTQQRQRGLDAQFRTLFPSSARQFDIGGPYFGFAAGTSRVPGTGSGMLDTVPAMLAPGEAVLNRAASDALGRGLIAALNQRGAAKMGLV